MKEAFVQSVMNDVPSVDYVDHGKNLVQGELVKLVPKKLQDVYDDKDTRVHLDTSTAWFGSVYGYFYFGSLKDNLPEAVKEAAKALGKKSDEQAKTRQELRQKLNQALEPITTTKALKEAFPGYEKHYPYEETKPTTNVPSVLLGDLLTTLAAAGVPKEAVAAG